MPAPTVSTTTNRTNATGNEPQPTTAVRVTQGDSLSKLAGRFGVSIEALVRANVGKYPSLALDRNFIKVGWTLDVPAAAPVAAEPATPAAPTATDAAPWTGNTTPRPPPPPAGVTAATGVAGRNTLGERMAAAGAQSIEMRMKKHNDAIDRTGVGTYYGDHASWKSMSQAERQTWISEHVKPGVTAPPPSSVKESSCIGWAMENVGAAYAAAGKTERWNEIMRTVTAHGSKGMDLAKELKKDGWQSIYWNPDAKHPDDSNPEHSYSAIVAHRDHTYYGMKLDGTVENYRPTAGQGTTQDLSGIEKLKQVPFFFGLAKGGVHTFVGRKGEVNEFHWSEMPDSHHAIQQTPLQEWGWNSGVIMVPPGTWPTH